MLIDPKKCWRDGAQPHPLPTDADVLDGLMENGYAPARCLGLFFMWRSATGF